MAEGVGALDGSAGVGVDIDQVVRVAGDHPLHVLVVPGLDQGLGDGVQLVDVHRNPLLGFRSCATWRSSAITATTSKPGCGSSGSLSLWNAMKKGLPGGTLHVSPKSE